MNADNERTARRPVSTLSFFGAAQTVTGSRFLIESGGRRVLVDCGLFQGYKAFRERNRRAFPVAPGSIDAVVLTHAHLDHSGYLPALVRDGFTGPIYATPGTTELCSVLLPDSGHLLEEEANFARKRGSSVHENPRPLYTSVDAMRSLDSFRTRSFDDKIDLGSGIQATFVPAGHILGAAQVHVDVDGVSVHFTGDLGRIGDPLMRAPRPLEPVDILVAESTYGNRIHPDVDPEAELGSVIRRVAKRGGVVVIPAFAVGRSESLLLHLSRLRARRAIPDIPVIVSASGMLTGGRVLHHVAAYGSDPKNAIILTGYQAGGTRGAALARGDDHLRIYGRDVPIGAEVVHLESLSAHADSNEILRWMRNTPRPPTMTYIVHGEPDAADALRLRIKRELRRKVRVPEHLEAIDLNNPA